MILACCVFLSVNWGVFIAITLSLFVYTCIRLKKNFDTLQFEKIIDELNVRVISRRQYSLVPSEHGGIKNDEYNPATGLPMIGGVDVGGNPYGYSRHD